MTLSTRQRAGILLTLALVMMATRINHFSAIPDASWALFFLGGFYLRDMGRWAFPALMVLAVAVDWYVISASGISFWNHYCVSVAYWFLVPAYLSLWMGGLLLQRVYAGVSLRSGAWLLLSFLVSVSACYLISNGSFYWLSDSVSNASFAGWMKNLSDWYLPYLYTASMYVAGAAVLHVAIAQIARHLPARTPATQRASR
ncbi:hypothetical protein [Arenimonas oryziterrae]|uniref:Cobalamin ABC transporter n=1 Tax=Arenimonas oryziterrae DSM 21050 = YC6267 TaxID=1121015 RepID=A0A091AVU1_9GAMM|nr:hypothetical protein [Arenimonas oryziterrae]KFN43377.1 hypothetical protein N789_08870 [Arenimonas oryziterrae DSM 21050 = YC6267]